MTGIYELTLRATDGRERQTLAWFPTDEVRQDYYEKARKRGLEITEKPTPDPSQVGGSK